MWGTLIRGFAGWVAKNWAGVAAGYAIGDVAQNIAKPSEQEPKSKVVQKMQETFGRALPIWLYGLITAFLLFYIYRQIDKRVK